MHVIVDLPEDVYDQCRKVYQTDPVYTDIIHEAVAKGIAFPEGENKTFVEHDGKIFEVGITRKIVDEEKVELSSVLSILSKYENEFGYLPAEIYVDLYNLVKGGI